MENKLYDDYWNVLTIKVWDILYWYLLRDSFLMISSDKDAIQHFKEIDDLEYYGEGSYWTYNTLFVPEQLESWIKIFNLPKDLKPLEIKEIIVTNEIYNYIVDIINSSKENIYIEYEWKEVSYDKTIFDTINEETLPEYKKNALAYFYEYQWFLKMIWTDKNIECAKKLILDWDISRFRDYVKSYDNFDTGWDSWWENTKEHLITKIETCYKVKTD